VGGGVGVAGTMTSRMTEETWLDSC
jgi:hypothetical protein